MSNTAIRSLPKQGILVDMQVFDEVRLNCGDGTVWNDKDNRDNLLFGRDSDLGSFFARFVEKRDGMALFELKRNGREFASKSEPINPAKGIPEELKVELENAYRAFHDRLADPKATDEAKEFIQSLRMSDPQSNPDMYRIYKDGTREKLLVIWGCSRKGSQPLLPLDAIQRLPTYRRSNMLMKVLALLLGLCALLAGAMGIMYLVGPNDQQQIAKMDRIAQVTPVPTPDPVTDPINPPVPPSAPDPIGRVEPDPVLEPKTVDPPALPDPQHDESPKPNDSEPGKDRVESPKTNATEPPFLFVSPQAIISGDQIQIVPRTTGILSMYGYRGERYLNRKASGVDDAEALRFYLAGMRIMAFEPADSKFKEERIPFVVFDKPEIRQQWIRIKLPAGLECKDSRIDWADGQSDSISDPTKSQYTHAYQRSGLYKIRFIPSPEIAWAAIEMPVEISVPLQ